MSWWVYLEDDGGPVTVERHEEGGTRQLGGTDRAELNVTYNYGDLFREAWPEQLAGADALEQMLHGRSARETEPLLDLACKRLVVKAGGVDKLLREKSSYWEATPRNALLPLLRLHLWAKEHPDATWRVS